MLITVALLMSIAFSATKSEVRQSPDKIVSLDFKVIPVRELLQFIAETMGYNIIMSEHVTGNVSLHFHDITWQNALKTILEMAGLVKKQEGNILLIGTPHEFALRQKILSESSPYKVVKVKIQHTDADFVKNTLKTQTDLFTANSKISLNPRENSLTIKDTTENLPYLINYLHEIDQPEKQVLIAAKIINIDDKKIHELGVCFKQNTRPHSAQGLNISTPELNMNSFQFAIASIGQQQLLNLQIHALETTGQSKIIADPTLITQNRKPAVIEAGEEIPYQESTSSGATSVTFKKAALSLKVTPTVLPDGRIVLELEIHQNKISPIAVNGTPAIQTQELKTQVVIHDGETLILGGIFEKSEAEATHEIPGVCRVPLLGSLLSQKNKHFVRKELLIFVSPHILSS